MEERNEGSFREMGIIPCQESMEAAAAGPPKGFLFSGRPACFLFKIAIVPLIFLR
jgi:hypothetical protein